jgi:prepilin-type processing-associated H-X9-DG protein
MAHLLRVSLLYFLITAVTPTFATAQDKLPPDLALVPADALGFVHVRVADVWKSEPFKEWRATILKAGDEALAALDKRFVPAPSSIERVTAVLLAPAPGEREPNPLIALTTSQAIDKDAFLRHTVPDARQERAGDKSFYVHEKTNTAFFFVNDRTLALGTSAAVRTALTRGAARQGPLAEAVALANTGTPLVIAANASALPPDVLQRVPPPFQPLVQARLAVITVDLKEIGRIDVRLNYATADAAADAEQAARAGLKMARGMLTGAKQELMKKIVGDGQPGTLAELPEAAGSVAALGALNRLDEFLADAPLKRDGSALKLAIEFPFGGPQTLSAAAIAVGLLVPAVQKVREAATRTQDANNLKQIGLAMHFHADAHKGFPAAAICDANGKPLLSWRVAILPYIEQEPLYKQFKLDEPWDSAHNRKLIPLMPPTYASPVAPPKPGETHYQSLVGGGAILEMNKKTRFADITDGTSNTLLVVETAESVPWTKPADIAYDPEQPLPRLATFIGGRMSNALFADGSVRLLIADTPEGVLRAMITRAGGEVVDVP